MLTVVDHFTKHAEALPIRNKEAVTVARALWDAVFSRYGLPMQILSDCGSEFENGLMRQLCKLLDIDKLRTVAYKPSTNGAVERFHRTLTSMLAKVVRETQKDWDTYLPSVMAAYRASPHSSTGFSPNFLFFGREVRAPVDVIYGGVSERKEGASTLEQYAEEKVDIMKRAYQLTREHLGQTGRRMKKYYDMKVKPKVYLKGTWVWYHNPRRYVGRSSKLAKQWTGPFLIVRMLDPVNVVLQQSARAKPIVTNINKLKLYLGPALNTWIDPENTSSKETSREVTGLNSSVENDEARNRLTVIEEEIIPAVVEDGGTSFESQSPAIGLTRSRWTIRPPWRSPEEGYGTRRLRVVSPVDDVMPGVIQTTRPLYGVIDKQGVYRRLSGAPELNGEHERRGFQAPRQGRVRFDRGGTYPHRNDRPRGRGQAGRRGPISRQ